MGDFEENTYVKMNESWNYTKFHKKALNRQWLAEARVFQKVLKK